MSVWGGLYIAKSYAYSYLVNDEEKMIKLEFVSAADVLIISLSVNNIGHKKNLFVII